jgi:hypothetical protein
MCLLTPSFLQYTLPYDSLNFYIVKELLFSIFFIVHTFLLVFNSLSQYYVLGISYDSIISSLI